ncbi:MAG: NlpC/P60 family protein [Sphingomonadaceae bacterium]
MTTVQTAFAEAAEALEGCPFRLHGRDHEYGLDCVGVVLCALQDAGLIAPPTTAYALRNSSIVRFIPLFERAGFVFVKDAITTGDLLVARPGPAQYHCVIALTQARFIHAHAGIGRVVIQNGPLGWPVVQHWRLDPAF